MPRRSISLGMMLNANQDQAEKMKEIWFKEQAEENAKNEKLKEITEEQDEKED